MLCMLPRTAELLRPRDGCTKTWGTSFSPGSSIYKPGQVFQLWLWCPVGREDTGASTKRMQVFMQINRPSFRCCAWKPATELLQNQARFAVMFPTSQGNHPGDLCLDGPCNKHHILRPFSVLSSQVAKPHGAVKQGRQFLQTSFLQSGLA